jgi:serine/threonine-protein kinase HipA
MAVRKLDVYREGVLVGTLLDETPIKFVYDAGWRLHQQPSVSPNINIAQLEHSGEAVESYFENLLPEAGIRDVLKLKFQVTSTFGLLRAIGGDSASDLTILPEGDSPQPPSYQSITWQDISDLFSQQPGVIASIQEQDGLRISLAGAQRKISICIDDMGNPLLPLGSSPSTYIVKPDIKGIEGVWASAINETMVMKLAAALGLGTAEVNYQPAVKACVVRRYDRLTTSDGQIKRLHQLDLCQLDGKPSTVKYESDGGPTLLRCRELLGSNGVGAADIKRFIQWLFFNLYVGNHDSHAKNLSIYYPDNQIKLAPFYDLLSTSFYSGLSHTFAFRLGGENKPSHIQREQIFEMATQLGFKPGYVLNIAENLASLIQEKLAEVATETDAMASIGTEKTLVERLNHHILSTTKGFQNLLFTNKT